MASMIERDVSGGTFAITVNGQEVPVGIVPLSTGRGEHDMKPVFMARYMGLTYEEDSWDKLRKVLREFEQKKRGVRIKVEFLQFRYVGHSGYMVRGTVGGVDGKQLLVSWKGGEKGKLHRLALGTVLRPDLTPGQQQEFIVALRLYNEAKAVLTKLENDYGIQLGKLVDRALKQAEDGKQKKGGKQ